MHVFDKYDALDQDETERVYSVVIVNPSGVCGQRCELTQSSVFVLRNNPVEKSRLPALCVTRQRYYWESKLFTMFPESCLLRVDVAQLFLHMRDSFTCTSLVISVRVLPWTTPADLFSEDTFQSQKLFAPGESVLEFS